jgi:hypothetical protein
MIAPLRIGQDTPDKSKHGDQGLLSPILRAGLPATTSKSGTSCVTTAPAATIEPTWGGPTTSTPIGICSPKSAISPSRAMAMSRPARYSPSSTNAPAPRTSSTTRICATPASSCSIAPATIYCRSATSPATATIGANHHEALPRPQRREGGRAVRELRLGKPCSSTGKAAARADAAVASN